MAKLHIYHGDEAQADCVKNVHWAEMFKLQTWEWGASRGKIMTSIGLELGEPVSIGMCVCR